MLFTTTYIVLKMKFLLDNQRKYFWAAHSPENVAFVTAQIHIKMRTSSCCQLLLEKRKLFVSQYFLIERQFNKSLHPNFVSLTVGSKASLRGMEKEIVMKAHLHFRTKVEKIVEGKCRRIEY